MAPLQSSAARRVHPAPQDCAPPTLPNSTQDVDELPLEAGVGVALEVEDLTSQSSREQEVMSVEGARAGPDRVLPRHFLPRWWSDSTRTAPEAEGCGGVLRDGHARGDRRRSEPSVPTRDGHRVPWRQNAALTAWCMTLLLGYAETRIACSYGVPSDCKLSKTPVETGSDLQTLLLLGLVLALFTDLHLPARFGYIFHFGRPHPRGIAFLGLFFATPPLYGLLNFVFPHFSLSEGGMASPLSWVLLVSSALGLVALLVWHLRAACIQKSWKAFLAYAAPRVVVLGCFVAFNALVPLVVGDYDIHVHHYMVAFVVASLAEFNHPVSLAALAISAGIFVQGIAAYDAAVAVEQKSPPGFTFNFRCGSGANVHSPPVDDAFVAWASNNSCKLTCGDPCIT